MHICVDFQSGPSKEYLIFFLSHFSHFVWHRWKNFHHATAEVCLIWRFSRLRFNWSNVKWITSFCPCVFLAVIRFQGAANFTHIHDSNQLLLCGSGHLHKRIVISDALIFVLRVVVVFLRSREGKQHAQASEINYRIWFPCISLPLYQS